MWQKSWLIMKSARCRHKGTWRFVEYLLPIYTCFVELRLWKSKRQHCDKVNIASYDPISDYLNSNRNYYHQLGENIILELIFWSVWTRFKIFMIRISKLLRLWKHRQSFTFIIVIIKDSLRIILCNMPSNFDQQQIGITPQTSNITLR